MLTLNQIKNKLFDRNLRKVSKLSGVSYATLMQIKNGEANPTYKTLHTLSEYLNEDNK